MNGDAISFCNRVIERRWLLLASAPLVEVLVPISDDHAGVQQVPVPAREPWRRPGGQAAGREA
jgi:hypothetical protein